MDETFYSSVTLDFLEKNDLLIENIVKLYFEFQQNVLPHYGVVSKSFRAIMSSDEGFFFLDILYHGVGVGS